MKTLNTAHVNTWLFDLDNTLYPPSTQHELLRVYDQMVKFAQQRWNLDVGNAREMVSDPHRRHGATVLGFVREKGIPPEAFLRTTYDNTTLDLLDTWRDSPELTEARQRLAALPGRRIIFTNAVAEYAERTLDHLGLKHLFEDVIVDVRFGGYHPKPMPQIYDALLGFTGIDPKHAVFVEDTQKNLAPAKEMGMTTILVNRPDETPQPFVDAAFPDLLSFLRQVTV